MQGTIHSCSVFPPPSGNQTVITQSNQRGVLKEGKVSITVMATPFAFVPPQFEHTSEEATGYILVHPTALVKQEHI